MKQEIKVSVITVVYNGKLHIEQTIKSVLNQTYSNIEYIIIDGGSTDGTIEIIKRYEKQLAYWVSEPDSGIYDAMNKGIKKATGELIGILNSDDWYEPDAISWAVNEYDKDTVVYGLIRHVLGDKRLKIYAPYPSLIIKEMIPHPTCFVPLNIYKKYGCFALEYKSCADYQFILRLFSSGVQFKLVERVLANFRLGGFSWSVSSLCESYDMRYKMGYISNFERILKKFALRITNGKILRL